ncbi:DUF1298 domain-containing protein [Rhodococcus sp. BP-316]|uniref:wax ester/triacylglycerol synthase domain-containing protein n=1 Tax=Rhodococcus sp. BP-316 TaxID=2739445 RepID=UPI001C9A4096|nr:WS/DGAT domain-containing protein [Rhodococcus sp. BP-316]MBY6682667.1 DUF1298 domain-containing protein [Rhodococcus sp. BP-316]
MTSLISRPRGVRLHPRDAVNILAESERMVANLVEVVVFHPHPGTEADTLDLGTIAEWLVPRLETVPQFRRVLRRSRWDLGDSFWIDSPRPDHAAGLSVTQVSEPGWAPVENAVTSMMNERMNLSERTWEIRFLTGTSHIQGVPDGACFALVKVHHSIMDGLGLADALKTIFGDDVSLPRREDETWGHHAAERVPTSLKNAVTLPYGLLKYVRRYLLERKDGDASEEGRPTHPATRFDGRTDRGTVCRVMWFDVDDIKRSRAAVPGSTTNDVLLGIVSGAMQRYLEEIGERPEGSLGSTVPIALDGTESANRASFLTVSLHSDVSDVRKRLAAIQRSTAMAKAGIAKKTQSARRRSIDVIPPIVVKVFMSLQSRNRATPVNVASNTVLSNMMHGDSRLELLGRPAFGIFTPMPIVDGFGLCHHAGTLGDTLALTITADASMLTDPDRYCALIEEAQHSLNSLAS